MGPWFCGSLLCRGLFFAATHSTCSFFSRAFFSSLSKQSQTFSTSLSSAFSAATLHLSSHLFSLSAFFSAHFCRHSASCSLCQYLANHLVPSAAAALAIETCSGNS